MKELEGIKGTPIKIEIRNKNNLGSITKKIYLMANSFIVIKMPILAKLRQSELAKKVTAINEKATFSAESIQIYRKDTGYIMTFVIMKLLLIPH